MLIPHSVFIKPLVVNPYVKIKDMTLPGHVRDYRMYGTIHLLGFDKKRGIAYPFSVKKWIYYITHHCLHGTYHGIDQI